MHGSESVRRQRAHAVDILLIKDVIDVGAKLEPIIGVTPIRPEVQTLRGLAVLHAANDGATELLAAFGIAPAFAGLGVSAQELDLGSVRHRPGLAGAGRDGPFRRACGLTGQVDA